MKMVKSIIEFILFGFVFVGLMILCGFLDSAPLQIALIVAISLGVILLAAWLAIAIYQDLMDNQPLVTDPELWVSDGEKWVSMADQTKTRPFQSRSESKQSILFFDKENPQ